MGHASVAAAAFLVAVNVGGDNTPNPHRVALACAQDAERLWPNGDAWRAPASRNTMSASASRAAKLWRHRKRQRLPEILLPQGAQDKPQCRAGLDGEA